MISKENHRPPEDETELGEMGFSVLTGPVPITDGSGKHKAAEATPTVPNSSKHPAESARVLSASEVQARKVLGELVGKCHAELFTPTFNVEDKLHEALKGYHEHITPLTIVYNSGAVCQMLKTYSTSSHDEFLVSPLAAEVFKGNDISVRTAHDALLIWLDALRNAELLEPRKQTTEEEHFPGVCDRCGAAVAADRRLCSECDATMKSKPLVSKHLDQTEVFHSDQLTGTTKHNAGAAAKADAEYYVGGLPAKKFVIIAGLLLIVIAVAAWFAFGEYLM